MIERSSAKLCFRSIHWSIPNTLVVPEKSTAHVATKWITFSTDRFYYVDFMYIYLICKFVVLVQVDKIRSNKHYDYRSSWSYLLRPMHIAAETSNSPYPSFVIVGVESLVLSNRSVNLIFIVETARFRVIPEFL
jgi:hypothetical protein